MCWRHFPGRSVEVLDTIIVDQSPLFVDRLVTPPLPAAAWTALRLHQKPAYFPHHLKAYPAKRLVAVPHSKIIHPTHNDRSDSLKDFLELSMLGKLSSRVTVNEHHHVIGIPSVKNALPFPLPSPLSHLLFQRSIQLIQIHIG